MPVVTRVGNHRLHMDMSRIREPERLRQAHFIVSSPSAESREGAHQSSCSSASKSATSAAAISRSTERLQSSRPRDAPTFEFNTRCWFTVSCETEGAPDAG